MSCDDISHGVAENTLTSPDQFRENLTPGCERLHFDQPLIVLASYVQYVLDSEYLLAELVREVDAQWGRVLGERPYFEREGSPPLPDDPYTVESVRQTLSQLIEKLEARDT